MSREGQFLAELAGENGLKVDGQTGTVFGSKNGYTVYLLPVNGTKQLTLNVSVCGTQEPDVRELAGVVKQTKALMGCKVYGHKVVYTIRAGMSAQKRKDYVREALETVTSFLRQKNYSNCCEACGKPEPAEVYSVSGAARTLCAGCFSQVSTAAGFQHQQSIQKRENIVGGVVGALLGSLLGVVCIVLLGQLGYVAALSGVVMGVCTLKGYELLGGRLSVKGIVIGVVLMLVMVFVGNQADWAIFVARTWEIDVVTAFQAIPLLIQEEAIEAGSYYGNLGLVYLFTALGAVPTVVNTIRGKKYEHITAKMQQEG